MEPRVIARTHYQIHEPAYMTLLVQRCTAPTRGTYPEVAARRLAQEVGALGRRLNEKAAEYGVDLARAIGLLNEHCSWTDKALLLSLFWVKKEGGITDQLRLHPREQLVYLRLFLEADGAALLYLASKALELGKLPVGAWTWNALAQEMFLAIYQDYLAFTTSTPQRVWLREQIRRIRAKGYRGRGGEHKMLVHLQALYRLGLLRRAENETVREFRLPGDEGQVACLRCLVEGIRTVLALEEIIANGDWAEMACKALTSMSDCRGAGRAVQGDDQIISLGVTAYDRIMATGVPLCPLSTLCDAVAFESLLRAKACIGRQDVLDALNRFRQGNPKGVRFHVDRQGRPAYLRVSKDLVREVLGDV